MHWFDRLDRDDQVLVMAVARIEDEEAAKAVGQPPARKRRK